MTTGKWDLTITIRFKSYDYVFTVEPYYSTKYKAFIGISDSSVNSPSCDGKEEGAVWFMHDELPNFQTVKNSIEVSNFQKKNIDLYLPMKVLPKEGELEVKLCYVGSGEKKKVTVYELPFGRFSMKNLQKRSTRNKSYPVTNGMQNMSGLFHADKQRSEGKSDRLIFWILNSVLKGVRVAVPIDELPEVFKNQTDIKKKLEEDNLLKPKIRFSTTSLINEILFNSTEPPALVSPLKVPENVDSVLLKRLESNSVPLFELRVELQKRNLSLKGPFAALAKRLKNALTITQNVLTQSPLKPSLQLSPIKSVLRSPISNVHRIRPIPFSPLEKGYVQELKKNTLNNASAVIHINGHRATPDELTLPQLRKQIRLRGEKIGKAKSNRQILISQLRLLLTKDIVVADEPPEFIDESVSISNEEGDNSSTTSTEEIKTESESEDQQQSITDQSQQTETNSEITTLKIRKRKRISLVKKPSPSLIRPKKRRKLADKHKKLKSEMEMDEETSNHSDIGTPDIPSTGTPDISETTSQEGSEDIFDKSEVVPPENHQSDNTPSTDHVQDIVAIPKQEFQVYLQKMKHVSELLESIDSQKDALKQNLDHIQEEIHTILSIVNSDTVNNKTNH